jgi:hypothetical protein
MNKELEALKERIEWLKKQLEERPKKRLKKEKYFNGTDIYTFFFMMEEQYWGLNKTTKFSLTVDDIEKGEFTVSNIKEKFRDYYINDYDVYCDIIEDNFQPTGWIGLVKDDAQFIIQELYEQIEELKQINKKYVDKIGDIYE